MRVRPRAPAMIRQAAEVAETLTTPEKDKNAVARRNKSAATRPVTNQDREEEEANAPRMKRADAAGAMKIAAVVARAIKTQAVEEAIEVPTIKEAIEAIKEAIDPTPAI